LNALRSLVRHLGDGPQPHEAFFVVVAVAELGLRIPARCKISTEFLVTVRQFLDHLVTLEGSIQSHKHLLGLRESQELPTRGSRILDDHLNQSS
jgi:hypothetical protein